MLAAGSLAGCAASSVAPAPASPAEEHTTPATAAAPAGQSPAPSGACFGLCAPGQPVDVHGMPLPIDGDKQRVGVEMCRRDCVIEDAKAKKDPKACDRVMDVVTDGKDREYAFCLRQLADAAHDPTICDAATTPSAHDQCWHDVAIPTANKTLCAKVGDAALREDCVRWIDKNAS